MIWFLIWFILLGICIWARKKDGENKETYVRIKVAVFLIGGCIILVSFVNTVKNIRIDSILERNRKNIVVYEEKYENIKNLVVERVSSYPLEEKLIKSFNPTILLSLPEIKSDKIVISIIEQLISIQNDIYKIRINSNGIQMYKDIVIRYKWYIPAFIYPKQ